MRYLLSVITNNHNVIDISNEKYDLFEGLPEEEHGIGVTLMVVH